MPTTARGYGLVLRELRRKGVLLESDKTFPCVVDRVAGERVEGSWWGHKDGHLIFNVVKRLRSSPEVLEAKLISGKVTLIHKALWPELFAACSAREAWQMGDLSSDAKRLLQLVEKKGEVRSDQIVWHRKRAVGDLVRELEKRLLVHSEEIHTAKGSHAKIVRSWRRLANEAKISTAPVNLETAKKSLEALVARLNMEHGSHGRLPWAHGEKRGLSAS